MFHHKELVDCSHEIKFHPLVLSQRHVSMDLKVVLTSNKSFLKLNVFLLLQSNIKNNLIYLTLVLNFHLSCFSQFPEPLKFQKSIDISRIYCCKVFWQKHLRFHVAILHPIRIGCLGKYDTRNHSILKFSSIWL